LANTVSFCGLRMG